MELLKEVDPYGMYQHQSGSKLDSGKVKAALVINGFARALNEVAKVGTFGANKYTDNGWVDVPDALSRYDNAKVRHMLEEGMGYLYDEDSGLLHAAHEAWNALAKLHFLLQELDTNDDHLGIG